MMVRSQCTFFLSWFADKSLRKQTNESPPVDLSPGLASTDERLRRDDRHVRVCRTQ